MIWSHDDISLFSDHDSDTSLLLRAQPISPGSEGLRSLLLRWDDPRNPRDHLRGCFVLFPELRRELPAVVDFEIGLPSVRDPIPSALMLQPACMAHHHQQEEAVKASYHQQQYNVQYNSQSPVVCEWMSIVQHSPEGSPARDGGVMAAAVRYGMAGEV